MLILDVKSQVKTPHRRPSRRQKENNTNGHRKLGYEYIKLA